MSAASSPLGTTGPVLGVAHPLYLQYRPVWQKCLDVYEGTGGFLSNDKPYIVPHPREWLDHSIPVKADDDTTVTTYVPNPHPSNPSPKLLERRTLARYENYAATLIDQLAAALFREQPKRTFDETAPVPASGKRPIELFWDDCDGLGTCWDDFLRQAWTAAGVFGHMVIYFDPPDMEADRIVPMARAYTPLDVPDWLVNDRGKMVSIKLLESAPRESFTTRVTVTAKTVRVRVVTEEGWSVQEPNGNAVDAGMHGFLQLPVMVLYAKRRAIVPFIGKSLLGDPQNFIDLYNMTSEERELLRKQTFSILNVPVGEGSIEQEQAKIGRQSGTGNILFTSQPASYISADGQNVEVYHAAEDRLVRSLFRSALLPWDTDSKDAEAEGSRRIKREDLNHQLAKYADELKTVDETATDLVYQAFYGASWERWRQKDGLALGWPDTFEVTPLEELLKRFTDGIAMELGDTATKELKKRAARVALPDLSATKQEAIDKEIDAMKVVTEEERRQDELKAAAGRLSGAFA